MARESPTSGESVDSRAIASPDFTGRQHEVAELTDALQHPPSLVVVEGEGGIGKTRLVREALDGADLDDDVLRAECPPYGEALTLGSVVESVRELAGNRITSLPLTPLTGVLRPLLPEWDAILPASPEPVADPGAARHRRFRALAELIGTLAAEALVVDDVHWADDATLDFLLYLTSRRQGHPLTIVMTYRPEDATPGTALTRLLSRRGAGPRFRRIGLQPLDADDTRALVRSMLGGEQVTRDFADFLHHRTDGIPLAIEETVRLLSDRADLIHRNGAWARRSLADLQVPPTIRDSVVDRINRLDDPTRQMLCALAVLAEPAGEELIARVADMSTEDARAAIGTAIATRLIDHETRRGYSFRHSLTRRAQYEVIPAPERRHLHRRAGLALEQTTTSQLAQLTRHFRESGDEERWLRYAEAAADLAVESDDHTTATVLLLPLLTGTAPPPETRDRLLGKLGAAALLRRDAVDDLHQQAVDVLQQAVDADDLDPATRAVIRSRLGRLLLQAGEFGAGRRQLELAVPGLESDPYETARVTTYLGYPLAAPRPVSEHLRWLDQAAQACARVHEPAAQLRLTIDRATALLLLGRTEGWAIAAQLPTTAADARTRHAIATGCTSLAYAARVWGRYGEARRLATMCEGLVDGEDERTPTDVGLTHAQLDWCGGVWDEVARRAEQVTEYATQNRQTRVELALLSGLVAAARGDTDHAENDLSYVLAEAPRHNVADVWCSASAAVGRLRLASGEVDDALAVTDEPVAMAVTTGLWVLAGPAVVVRATALLTAGRDREAASLVDTFDEGVAETDAPSAAAALATSRALLLEAHGDHAAAAAAFGAAVSMWAALPQPYDALLAGERQAQNVQHVDQDQAVGQLKQVFRGLDGLGARPDADRVAARLRGLGVDVQRQWRRGRRGYGADLSPRELEVVRLVATGQTNREIAELLCRSPKTIAAQVNSAMRKLGVSTRTALAVNALEDGIVIRDPD